MATELIPVKQFKFPATRATVFNLPGAAGGGKLVLIIDAKNTNDIYTIDPDDTGAGWTAHPSAIAIPVPPGSASTALITVHGGRSVQLFVKLGLISKW